MNTPIRVAKAIVADWRIQLLAILLLGIGYFLTATAPAIGVGEAYVSLALQAAWVWFFAGMIRNCLVPCWRRFRFRLFMFAVTNATIGAAIFFSWAVNASKEHFDFDEVVGDCGMLPSMPVTSRQLSTAGEAKDLDGEALLAAIVKPDASIALRVDTGVPRSLDRFFGQKRVLLLRHLASSAEWRLTRAVDDYAVNEPMIRRCSDEIPRRSLVAAVGRRGILDCGGHDNDRLVAYRRFVGVQGEWHDDAYGFYDCRRLADDEMGGPYIRLLLGLEISPLVTAQVKSVTRALVGTGTVELQQSQNDCLSRVSLVLESSAGIMLETYQASSKPCGNLAAAALPLLEREFEALLKSQAAKAQGFDLALMPPESSRQGKADLWLERERVDGVYQMYAYVNPAQPGYVYLKAFEARTNRALSQRSLHESSLEYVGWSNRSDQLFFCNSQIIIYERGRTHYPARFELWFVPEAGGPEQLIASRVFAIQGSGR